MTGGTTPGSLIQQNYYAHVFPHWEEVYIIRRNSGKRDWFLEGAAAGRLYLREC